MKPELDIQISDFEQETAERYTRIAADYSADWRGQIDEQQLTIIRRFEELIGPTPRIILDAGCGSGKHAVYFAGDGYRVIGLDLSPGMLRQAVENSNRRGVTIEPVIGNIRFPSLPAQGIDGVWSSAALVHLPPTARKDTVEQFYRVLNPGGVIYIGVQNLLTPKHIKRVGESYFCRLGYDENNKFYRRFKTVTEIAADLPLVDRLKLGYAFLDDRHWFYPTRTELFESLRQAGFAVIESNHCLARRLSIFAIKE